MKPHIGSEANLLSSYLPFPLFLLFNLAHSVWCINQNWHILFSDSSLEVLLQHLSLQDVDARDNEVCKLLTYSSEHIIVNIFEQPRKMQYV